MLPIKYITIHCAATPEGRPHKASEITMWDVERFNQPSYHYVVELDGKVVSTLPETTKGAHTGGANTGNIGICYVGGMDKDMKHAKDTRTLEQKVALRAVVSMLKTRYPGVVVRGHRDWPDVTKACPSFNVATEL
jgi:N-acetyl-anhydromuramyl-L-alanine amidase AmpD